MPLHWPSRVADRAVIEVVGPGRLKARLVDGGPSVDVVVPMWWPLPVRAIQAAGFGLIPVAEHAVAVGTQIALRLAAFGVTVIGMRRRPPDGPVPPFAAVYSADRLLECVADVDSVIISASQQAGHPPLVDDTVLRAIRPAALTSDYFAAASRRLGGALASYLEHQPPAGLLR
jgi:hypothetical protein